ncbi:MAG: hypothetical protein V4726_14180 [Verrucomicrobiota bacterium]
MPQTEHFHDFQQQNAIHYSTAQHQDNDIPAGDFGPSGACIQ